MIKRPKIADVQAIRKFISQGPGQQFQGSKNSRVWLRAANLRPDYVLQHKYRGKFVADEAPTDVPWLRYNCRKSLYFGSKLIANE